jgi:predicted PurR-regulated permease PerM
VHAIGWLLVGSVPGVLLGSQMSIRIPERVLRAAFGAILVLSGLKLIEVPGWALAAAALAAVTAFVLWFVADRLQRRGVAELS